MDWRSKVVRSKLTINAIQFASFTEAGRHSLSDVKQQFRNRCGAAEARGAHNSEDT